MKKIVLLFLTVLLSSSLIIGCSKKNKNEPNKKSEKTENKNETNNKKSGSNKIVKNSVASKSDLSYYPEDAMVIGEVDIESIKKIDKIKKIIDAELPKLEKEIGVSLSKLTHGNFYLDMESLNATPIAAAILTELDLNPLTSKAKKSEEFEGVKIFHMDSESGFAIIKKDTIVGTINAIKTMISLKKGKRKNLASSSNNALFKETLSKLGSTTLKVSFVPNTAIQAQIKKAAEEQPMAANFLNNFKAASAGVKIDNKNLTFYINAKSDQKAISDITNMINAQLKQMDGQIDKQLEALKQHVGDDGVKLMKQAYKSISIKADGEFILISFVIPIDLLEKAKNMVPMLMGL